MIEPLKAPLLRVLRVPAEPKPPAGSPGSIRTFRASRKFYYLRLIRWALVHLATLTGILVFLNLGPMPTNAWLLLRLMETAALVLFFLQLPFSFLLVGLDYDLRWYIVTDRSLRIRQGAVVVREMTMAFANIQQITVRQGPLQRLLGIADVEVRTAGGGGQVESTPGKGGKSGHLGYFHGVENAEEIRDLIVARLRQWRDAGLGDPDEDRTLQHVAAEKSSDAGVLSAARSVLAEVRALRSAIEACDGPKGRYQTAL